MIDTNKILEALERIEKLSSNLKIKRELDIIKKEIEEEISRRIDVAYASHAGDRSYW